MENKNRIKQQKQPITAQLTFDFHTISYAANILRLLLFKMNGKAFCNLSFAYKRLFCFVLSGIIERVFQKDVSSAHSSASI